MYSVPQAFEDLLHALKNEPKSRETSIAITNVELAMLMYKHGQSLNAPPA